MFGKNRRKRWDFQRFGANLLPNTEWHLGNVGMVFSGMLRANDASPYLGLVSVVLVGAAVTTAALCSLIRPQGPGMWTVLARQAMRSG
jgi:hypothetical protein